MKEDFLQVEEILFERDEKGQLLPIEATLERFGNKKILITPMPRGEFLRRATDKPKKADESEEDKKDNDLDIIKQHLIKPKIEDDAYESLPQNFIFDVANKVVSVSVRGKKDWKEAETEFKKK